ncbi:MAG: hypothetical protein AAB075_07000 [Gemmatimonadota bacterium]
MNGAKPLLIINATQEARRHRGFLPKLWVGLLVFNVGFIAWGVSAGHMQYDDPRALGYAGLVITIMGLLNHLAFLYPRLGWKGTALKTAAVTWLIAGMGYILFFSFIPMLTR